MDHMGPTLVPLIMSLPPLQQILASGTGEQDPLAQALSLLFEPSPVLFHHIIPQIISSSIFSFITSYLALIDLTVDTLNQCSDIRRAEFIAAHPRIGATKNLSALSSKEQGSTTTPDVIHRLAHLNACYERRYSGLCYITFVNGRSRAAIAEEMEDKLGIEHSLSPDEPSLAAFVAIKEGDELWKQELDRAVRDVGRIAGSRLAALKQT
ncbi:Oxo-4-hydroxy-4-carboxy-5-ureidoimidazoline decarboxylase [Hygrophoropsis aurantiaca]|uniref:Oxo-4-hydroxy-4-carboxy-5-ureidoimidazoline decarboxylase n=1 Tax=Hygrophoropsis aurantiaca TaxID=72124 RepID=A0ACB8A7M0_9AGAM|nr:Oxo-4-hydroxy-4-carboxy-5-ureidoimidazoline decarboxylase [Hygrophoropsis aurantiaca]